MEDIKEAKLNEILSELVQMVTDDKPASPGYWCDQAIKINMLRGTLDNQLVEMEGIMLEKECDLLEEDIPAAKAKILKTRAIDYKQYLELKAKINRVDEFIKLAKKRSTINEF
jgi:hypothetical protein|tara:strand:- start:1456 stop:1794 length:339 start_codon:yes stop_codon:yes gene_type:complete